MIFYDSQESGGPERFALGWCGIIVWDIAQYCIRVFLPSHYLKRRVRRSAQAALLLPTSICILWRFRSGYFSCIAGIQLENWCILYRLGDNVWVDRLYLQVWNWLSDLCQTLPFDGQLIGAQTVAGISKILIKIKEDNVCESKFRLSFGIWGKGLLQTG